MICLVATFVLLLSSGQSSKTNQDISKTDKVSKEYVVDFFESLFYKKRNLDLIDQNIKNT